MKKIPAGAEACNVLVGELEFLNKPVVAFIRLSPAVLLSGLAEVPIATRSLADSTISTILLKRISYSIHINMMVVIILWYNNAFIALGFCLFSWAPWEEDLSIMRLEGPLQHLWRMK